jgi:hypothetical protein
MARQFVLVVFFCVVLILPGEPARADNVQPCTVATATYTNSVASGKYIAIQCQEAMGTFFLAYISNPGTACPAVDIDSVKIWQSMAAASKLSGRPLTVYWNFSGFNCAGSSQKRIISSIDQ